MEAAPPWVNPRLWKRRMSQESRNTEHDPSREPPGPGLGDGKSKRPVEEDLATAFLRETEVIEESIENGQKVRRKGIYLLPNLFTTSALFAGFFSEIGRASCRERAAPSIT